MLIFPPTHDELYNGYSAEKLAYLEEFAIRDVEKLVTGRNYALLTNGYHVGVYTGCHFIIHEGGRCHCRDNTYKFVKTINGRDVTDCRSSEYIQQIGLYEIID
jgi:hypothetical protein